MTAQCATPLAWSGLVDYWAGDLDAAESERIEDHLFGCESCTAQLARMASIAETLRRAIPSVVAPEQVGQLRARGLVIEENAFAAGTRREVEFRPGVDLLIHHLQGLDLEHAERVQVSVRVESTGHLVFEDHFAPFDRARGEVLIACQRHFSNLPHDIVFDVSAHDATGELSRASFVVPHVFVAA